MRNMLVLCVFEAVLCAQPVLLPQTRTKADLEFLCSEELAGRLSMERGSDVAARYIAAEFQKAGLLPANGTSYLQSFPLVEFGIDAPASRLSLTRDGRTQQFAHGAQFSSRFFRNAEVRGAVVFAGYGITAPEYGYDDYAGLDVKGKVVFVFDHEPQEADPTSKWNGAGHTVHGSRQVKALNAQQHGASALILASEPLRKHPGLFDAATTSDGRSLRKSAPLQALPQGFIDIPLVLVSDAVAAALLEGSGKGAADWQDEVDRTLKPLSRELSGTSIGLRTLVSNSRRGRSYNVAGILPGSDPVAAAETVLLMAHYDHLGMEGSVLYPGANDNASGTVAVMELARLFAGGRARPRRTMLFIIFGSEEELMLGSFYYVTKPLRPVETTVAAINLDMIARDEAHIPQSRGAVEIPANTSNLINIIGAAYSPDLKTGVEWANRNTRLDLSYKYDADHTLNALFRCDHLPFLVKGIPTVWFFGGWHPGYHEPSDTVEQLNFTKLEKVMRLAYALAEGMANTNQKPAFLPPGGTAPPGRQKLRDATRTPGRY
jgi:hypothetical protein